MARSIATNTRVDRDDLLDFLRPRHHVVLMTTRADGRPQLSPVTGGVDEQGRIVVSTYPERAKVAQRSAATRGCRCCVLSDEWNGPWVQVDGTAEVLDLPDALEPLVEYFRCISGEHPDWDEYRAAMVAAGQVADPDHHRRAGARSPPAASRPASPTDPSFGGSTGWRASNTVSQARSTDTNGDP